MSINLQDKKVVVLGLGLSGQSCVRFAISQGAKVIALDSREALQVDLHIPVYLGEFDPTLLTGADLVLLSPGISVHSPIVQSARQMGITVMGDVALFADYNKTPVLAITGSNGKSTVTELTAAMLKADGKKVLTGGNIGTPVLDLLGKQADWLVLELSSFQLQDLQNLSAFAATVLNLSADHLDWHASMDEYRQAKLAIYRNARHTVVNRQAADCWPATAPALSFGDDLCPAHLDTASNWVRYQGKPIIDLQKVTLVGKHNQANIQAAAALALLAGASQSAIAEAAYAFKGLAHRCELVAETKQIRWINDSKATNVGATLAAIAGLQGSYSGDLHLIAGGDSKGADLAELQPCLQSNVANLITLGKDGADLAALHSQSQQVADMTAAVKAAAKVAKAGDLVLLSPACASLDMYQNYQERGQAFSQAVKELSA